MPSPFPGMDPYLGVPSIWPDFHANLAVEIKLRLNRQMSPAYYATVEIQTVVDEAGVDVSQIIRPDVSVYETPEVLEPVSSAPTTFAFSTAPIVRLAPLPMRLRSVRVYRVDTRELVTTIEILSPYNKRSGKDSLGAYREKREQVLAARVHLVEIDLLRGGERPGMELVAAPIATDYILLVNRFGVQRLSEIWPVALNETLPLIPVPLLPPDPDVPLDLNDAIREVYAGSRYEQRIRYQPPIPPPTVRPEMTTWVENLLATHAAAKS
jgi:hypothetical protein